MARSRIAVYLFQRKRKMGGEGAGREVLYYLVRWRSASGIERSVSLGKCSEITRVEAKKQRAIKEDEINRDVADRIPDIDESMTLGELLAFYPANRARGDAAVIYQAVLPKGDKLKEGPLKDRIEGVGEERATHTAAHPEVIATSARDGSGIPALRAALAALEKKG